MILGEHMKYYYLDLNRDTIQKLSHKIFTENIKVSDFVKQKIKDCETKIKKDNRILGFALPLHNKSTKEIQIILEEQQIPFTITEHHN